VIAVSVRTYFEKGTPPKSIMLHERVPERRLPPGFIAFNLGAFNDAVLH
jgi:hypothetical protein